MNGRSQAGDTLVEVTFAIAILSAVLASAFTVANLTQRVVAAAKERSVAVGLAQEQAEALRAYRDKDLSDSGSPSLATKFGAGLLQCAPPPLGTPPPPFYMQTSPSTKSGWVEHPGSTTKGLYNVTFTACPATTLFGLNVAPTGEYEFTISVTWQSNLAGPANTTKLVTRLANVQGMRPLDCSDANLCP